MEWQEFWHIFYLRPDKLATARHGRCQQPKPPPKPPQWLPLCPGFMHLEPHNNIQLPKLGGVVKHESDRFNLPNMRNLSNTEHMRRLPKTENPQLQMPKMRRQHTKPRIRRPIKGTVHGNGLFYKTLHSNQATCRRNSVRIAKRL
jgi:hypothetical protein